MNTILITGGCGYIGSHITLDIVEYIKECNRIILLDNFSNSRMNYKLMDIIGDQCEIIIINDDISLQENQLNHIFQKYKINIVFSSSKIKGEGEHKILDCLRNGQCKGTTIIYGLDADLIMLSMASKLDNIYLLREEVINGKTMENFIFVSII